MAKAGDKPSTKLAAALKAAQPPSHVAAKLVAQPPAADAVELARGRRLLSRDPAVVEIKRLKAALLSGATAPSRAEPAAADDTPSAAEPAFARDRGGRRDTWNWKDLKVELPDIVKKKPFEDRPAFEEWVQGNAQRRDTKPRKADPSIDAVRRAIIRHHLDEIPGLFKSA
jgi:hypothetical protein